MKPTSVVLVVFLAGCAMSFIDVAKQTVVGTLGALDAAGDGFSAFDAQKQQKIVAEAQSAEEARQNLAAWREQKKKVRQAFALVWSAVLDLAKAIPLVELGLAKEQDLSKWITAVLVEVDALKDTLSQAGVPVGPLEMLGTKPSPSPAPVL